MAIWLVSMFAYMNAGFLGLFAMIGLFNGTDRSIVIQHFVMSTIFVGVVLVCRHIEQRRRTFFEQRLNAYENGVREMDFGSLSGSD
jgi:hypothetical protein